MINLIRNLARLTGFSLSLIILTTIASSLNVGAETLTGIVKQPNTPYPPATSSTVIVYDKQTKQKVAGPDITDGEGRYRYDKIRKGQQVIVKASWKTELSSPGITETKVNRNPTEADVQLLPAKTAPAEKWLLAGKQVIPEKGGSVSELLRTLPETGVPSESIYRFILGMRQEAPGTYKGLNQIALFNTSSPERIAVAIKSAEEEYKSSSTIPTYQELQMKSNGLTEQQYLEVLGFIGTSNAKKDPATWNEALKKLSATESEDKVRYTSTRIEAAFSKPREAGVYGAAPPKSVFKDFKW
jgi:hypothetical protein